MTWWVSHQAGGRVQPGNKRRVPLWLTRPLAPPLQLPGVPCLGARDLRPVTFAHGRPWDGAPGTVPVNIVNGLPALPLVFQRATAGLIKARRPDVAEDS